MQIKDLNRCFPSLASPMHCCFFSFLNSDFFKYAFFPLPRVSEAEG